MCVHEHGRVCGRARKGDKDRKPHEERHTRRQPLSTVLGFFFKKRNGELTIGTREKITTMPVVLNLGYPPRVV